MLKAFKVEIKPTKEQANRINQSIGVVRFIYNLFISHNKKRHEDGKSFMGANDFSKWLNNSFIPENPEYIWVKEAPSKSVKQAMVYCEKAYKKFFKGLSGFPKTKKRYNEDTGMYLIGNKTSFHVERHRIKIPLFGYVRLKEFGYIPTNEKVSSCTITKRAGRYFISVLVKLEDKECLTNKNTGNPIGVDLGIKDFAICSDERVYKNINKTNKKIKKLESKLKREQRKLSKKIQISKKKKSKTGEYPTNKNLAKNNLRLKKIHYKLSNIRQGYVKFVVNDLLSGAPEYIAIEDLNVSGMMKNRHLSKAIQQQNFYFFRLFLTLRCSNLSIPLRVIGRFYPSSKLCSFCNNKHSNLKLKDRTFNCPSCGVSIDRDWNAALNIRDCEEFIIV